MSGNSPMRRPAGWLVKASAVDPACPVACAKKIMDDRDMSIDRYIMITGLGIEKTPGPAYNENDVQAVIDAVRKPLP
jgi:uncharacterized metal-binding protein